MTERSQQVAILTVLVLGIGAILTVVSIFAPDESLSTIIQYFGVAVPGVLGYVFLARKQDDNTEKTEKTEAHVGSLATTLNGKLDARFSEITTQIEALKNGETK